MSLNHVALKHLASSGFHKTGAVMFHKNWLDTITHYWILFTIFDQFLPCIEMYNIIAENWSIFSIIAENRRFLTLSLGLQGASEESDWETWSRLQVTEGR